MVILCNSLIFYLKSPPERNKRSGWVKRNIKEAESVSDHSQDSIACNALFQSPWIECRKMHKMALIHDIHEVYTGDIILTRANEKQNSKKN